MNLRRAIVLVVLAVIVAGAVVINREQPTSVAAAFGTNVQPVMPVAPTGDALTTSWYCPGVPATAAGTDGSGRFTILNPSDTPLSGAVTLYPQGGAPVVQPLAIEPRAQLDVNPAQAAPAAFTGALVEVYGTNGIVQQTTTTKGGIDSAPCSTTASATWYLADGSTTVDATFALLLLNPFPDDAIVNVTFAAADGSRTPGSLDGLVIPARSLKTVSVDQTLKLRDPLVSTSVQARSGRVVMGRFQVLPYAPRKGLVANLAVPSTGSEWWFANGVKGDGYAERIVLYNPGDSDANVDVTIFPADAAAGAPIPLNPTVAAGQRVQIDLSQNEQVPAGRFSVVVSTAADQPIVAERVLDLTGDRQTTTVQAGSRETAARWYVPIPPPGGGLASLTITNATGVDTAVAVSALGVAGATPVPSLQQVQIPAASTVQIDLNAANAASFPLVVDADGPVVVEQFVVPGGGQAGAWSTLGVPVAST